MCSSDSDFEIDTPALPRLPSELVLDILELAASADKETAAAISLVSHAARRAALPRLFGTLAFGTSERCYTLALIGSIAFLRSHQHIAAHIHNLWLPQPHFLNLVLTAHCTRLERIAVVPSHLHTFFRFSGTRFKRRGAPQTTPYELVILPGHCDWGAFQLGVGYGVAVFANITHLWLTQLAQLQALMDCKPAASALINITHLATPWLGFSIMVSDIYELFHSLRLLVITVFSRKTDAPFTESSKLILACEGDLSEDYDDQKAVIYSFPEERVEDTIFPLWKDAALGGLGLWDKAEALLRKNHKR